MKAKVSRSALWIIGLTVCAAPRTSWSQAAAVATGDARTVTEPVFPATCQVLQSSFHDVNEDVPASVEQASTNLDQARLQAALNACAGSGKAVELSQDNSGSNAFLSGPLSIPSGVTLLIDPGVTLYFSRNAQDYDTTPGVHTCGTVSGASNTASCQNLISINGVHDVGIMGYGKINGRGGDVVLNSFPTSGYEASTAGKSWWDLANDSNTLGGGQQNPRGIQISNATNVAFYKFTFKNAPNFHVAVNKVNGFTVWGMHIVTPYSARNTDGIDPGNATNVTITQSWISDGDDNIALGANASPTANISIINNRFFAGHGESIGSLTAQGVSNALFDNNTMYGDAEVDGSNSTAIRIKSANDRGGLVQNIQFSNSCFADHGTQVQLTPVYNNNAGTLTPNYRNILLQNLRFSTQGPVATGSFTFLGAVNGSTINPLQVQLDNVTVDTIASSNLVAPSNAQIILGPGQVSSNLVNLLQPFNGVNGNTINDQRTATTLNPPACNFVFLYPDLTGPQGVSQTVTTGQYPTVAVILQPAFALAQAPYPTGTVTLTDEAGRAFSATLSGKDDTTFVPVTNAPTGTHTYTAAYSGDANYPAITSFGSYTATVTGGSLPATTTTLSGVPATQSFGNPFTATAVVSGNGNLNGSVNFLVNGAFYATVPLSGGVASLSLNLGVGSYSIGAVYSGDNNDASSTANAAAVTVGAATTRTQLQSTATTGVVGTPVPLTATVVSSAGAPTGSISFSYTNAANSKAIVLGTASLVNGTASYSAFLPEGIDVVTATFLGSSNFGTSVSSPVTIAVSAPNAVAAPALPIALPVLTSTIAGGGSSNTACAGSVDSFGDGCLATSIVLPTGTDLRSVAADTLGNVYFTDATSSLIRKISPSGIVTRFAGFISGATCVPTGTSGCTPTLVKLGGKPRGIFTDTNNNLFIAGYSDNKVYEVQASNGLLYLIAGTGTAPVNTTDNAGDGGPALSALLKGPRAAATDSVGNVYIADSGDNRIREVLTSSSGASASTVQTIAGTGVSGFAGDGGLATAALLSNPQGVITDNNGNVYIAEGSHVRAVCVSCSPGVGLYALLNKLGVTNPANGNIYSVAGTTSSSNTKLAPGLGTTVSMGPQKLAMDTDGNLYISDAANNVIWFEDGRTGYTRVLAGGGTASTCSGSAIGDGCAATQAIFGSNGGNGFGLALDPQNNLYISDSTNLRIRKVSSDLTFAAPINVGASAVQPLLLHSQPGDNFTSLTFSAPDFSAGNGNCTILPDTTEDCAYPLTFAPSTEGTRTALLNVATAASSNNGTFQISGTATAPVAPQLISTATIARQSDSSLLATVSVHNIGNGAATAVTLTGYTLGSLSSASTPINLGTIAAGATATATVSVPGSAGASGSTVLQRITGTYSGSNIGASARVRLP